MLFTSSGKGTGRIVLYDVVHELIEVLSGIGLPTLIEVAAEILYTVGCCKGLDHIPGRGVFLKGLMAAA